MNDSARDTLEHISKVTDYLFICAEILKHRGLMHDASKLKNPEKEIFDEYTPELKDLEYGSKEYTYTLEKMKPAIEHHYKHNSHHPEHYENGVDGMSLFDVMEMVMDWKAASERHDTGDIRKSLEINRKRFNLSQQLVSIINNTFDEMEW